MEIIQSNGKCRKGRRSTYLIDANHALVSIVTNERGAFLKTYFCAGSRHADRYVLALDKGTPLLIPAEYDGYKVAAIRDRQAGHIRFKLTEEGINAFGVEKARCMRENIAWHKEIVRRLRKHESLDGMGDSPPNDDVTISCEIDSDKRVWIVD